MRYIFGGDAVRLVDVEKLDVVSWQSIPEGYSDTFEDGVRWILEKIDKLPPEPELIVSPLLKEKR